ncbi:MAG: PhnD/SsuA/transferrin family substrate-binding protein [Deltaproteobacteria bacterium]|nr:PhnD/SsuA/transferrin family substrate-binding protein [Deltaproteobacteria bacterium]
MRITPLPIVVLVAVLALWLARGGLAQSPPPPQRALHAFEMHASFMRSSFSGVNETDARAAFGVFVRRMGEKRGYAITPHLHIVDDAEALRELLNRQTVNMVVLDSWDYLALAPLTNYPATFAAVEQGVIQEEYLVLVGADSGLTGLADLAGKQALVLRSSNTSNAGHWFRTEILALGRGAPEAFLSRLEVRGQLSQTVLPVFFGKADACAVDRQGFATMIEMNPQVGKRLKVLVQSEPYLDTLICVQLAGWERDGMRQDMMDAMLEMPNDPAGRQIMSLFKFNGMAPFEDRYIESMRALRKRHDALTGGQP